MRKKKVFIIEVDWEQIWTGDSKDGFTGDLLYYKSDVLLYLSAINDYDTLECLERLVDDRAKNLLEQELRNSK